MTDVAGMGQRMPARAEVGEPVRVLVVDGHPLVRGVVRVACEATPRLAIVGEFDRGLRGLEACRRLEPDVVVLDLSLPDVDGIELIRRLQEQGRPPGILVLTDRSDGEAVLSSLRAGAGGFLSRPSGLREVGRAILAVAAGKRVVPEQPGQDALVALGRLARRTRERHRVVAVVTPREVQVLELLAEGLTVQQVGTRLGISPRTVETHIGKLYRKLGARTRVQAIGKAASLGLVDLG